MKRQNIIFTTQADFRALQQVSGAMNYSLQHNTLDAYQEEKEIYKALLNNILD